MSYWIGVPCHASHRSHSKPTAYTILGQTTSTAESWRASPEKLKGPRASGTQLTIKDQHQRGNQFVGVVFMFGSTHLMTYLLALWSTIPSNDRSLVKRQNNTSHIISFYNMPGWITCTAVDRTLKPFFGRTWFPDKVNSTKPRLVQKNLPHRSTPAKNQGSDCIETVQHPSVVLALSHRDNPKCRR